MSEMLTVAEIDALPDDYPDKATLRALKRMARALAVLEERRLEVFVYDRASIGGTEPTGWIVGMDARFEDSRLTLLGAIEAADAAKCS